MSYTSRLVALLGRFRRERNGLVADTMHYDGKRYGLNYGVSLATVRAILRDEPIDHDFARYLYGQDVRCLQLSALHLADPRLLADPAEAGFWMEGLRNSELAEEAAFALLSRCESLTSIVAHDPLAWYALLMAAVRSEQPAIGWIERSLTELHRLADDKTAPLYAQRLLLRATVTLWSRLLGTSPAGAAAVRTALEGLGDTTWEIHLADELRWRLDYQ